MPIVNYVREHTRFMEYASDEHLSSSERLLWYALMHIFNQRAQGNVWPDEFIRINNDRLLAYCPVKYDTMAAARNSLKQRGLIEYIQGEKNKKSPSYRMNYFYPQYVAPETEKDGESYPKKSDYIGGYMGDNMGCKPGVTRGDTSGTLYINNKEKYIPNPKDFEEDEDDDEATRAREEEVKIAWKMWFGREATPGVVRDLAWRAGMMGFEIGVVTEAIRIAAQKDAKSPTDYVVSLLCDWQEEKVRTKADVEKYVALRTVATSNRYRPFIDADVNDLANFRKQRETEEDHA